MVRCTFRKRYIISFALSQQLSTVILSVIMNFSNAASFWFGWRENHCHICLYWQGQWNLWKSELWQKWWLDTCWWYWMFSVRCNCRLFRRRLDSGHVRIWVCKLFHIECQWNWNQHRRKYCWAYLWLHKIRPGKLHKFAVQANILFFQSPNYGYRNRKYIMRHLKVWYNFWRNRIRWLPYRCCQHSSLDSKL